jgi:hypothetical protein
MYVATVQQTLNPLLSSVQRVGAITLNQQGPTDLSQFRIYTPFRYPIYFALRLTPLNSPQLGSGDTTLDIYFAGANTEAAFLLPGPVCLRSRFLPGFFENSTWWQMVKQQEFARGVAEICLVTDVLTTNRWASEYRTNALPNETYYAVNQKDGPYDTRFSDLQLQHSSLSNSVWTAQFNDREVYTVLACHIPVQMRNIGSFGRWAIRFQKYDFLSAHLTCLVHSK